MALQIALWDIQVKSWMSINTCAFPHFLGGLKKVRRHSY